MAVEQDFDPQTGQRSLRARLRGVSGIPGHCSSDLSGGVSNLQSVLANAQETYISPGRRFLSSGTCRFRQDWRLSDELVDDLDVRTSGWKTPLPRPNYCC
jgi:hypothetical protein